MMKTSARLPGQVQLNLSVGRLVGRSVVASCTALGAQSRQLEARGSSSNWTVGFAAARVSGSIGSPTGGGRRFGLPIELRFGVGVAAGAAASLAEAAFLPACLPGSARPIEWEAIALRWPAKVMGCPMHTTNCNAANWLSSLANEATNGPAREI